MLAGHPHGHPSLLELGGLIQHQDSPRIGKVAQDEPLQRAQRLLPVPGVPGQQGLHPPRRPMPGGLGELPARAAVPARRQQRANVGKRHQARPGLAEHWRQPGAQLIVKASQPAAILYDGPSGHLLILSSHRA